LSHEPPETETRPHWKLEPQAVGLGRTQTLEMGSEWRRG